jgi:hypothetical protein
MIDANVSLSRWPFRRLPHDETPALVAALRERGVTEAWAGSFDALLHRDVAAVNARLADECRRLGGGLLVPFGTVNPRLPDWEEDLRRCHEEHRMPGLRLHPNYHGYALDDPDFARLLRAAAERGLVVQVAVKMEDERTHHPLVRVPMADPAPLARLLSERPGLKLVVLNALKDVRGPALEALAKAGAAFDLAMLEGVGGVGRAIAQIGAERLLFGSHFPFFVFESAVLKLRESGVEGEAARAILEGNARRLLPGR